MSLGDINLDFERSARLGFDEAIFCSGKSVADISIILEQANERHVTLLLTRLSPDQLAALPQQQRAQVDYDPVSRTGYLGTPQLTYPHPQVAVVTAGTSDVRVSREATRTLRYYGYSAAEFSDVGVAGLWRLMDRIHEIRENPIVIVAAGMDAALPSVVGGLVPGIVIAVPTSVGYGVAEGGTTALHAALASCAPGIVVVNIDNGYGAACAALRILKTITVAHASAAVAGQNT